MTGIDGVCREVCEAIEFVTIVTMGDDGPHVVGNWGDYMRGLGIKDNTIILSAGRYRQTEKIFARITGSCYWSPPRRRKELAALAKGCLIVGTGEILRSGDIVDAVKAKFPWARGAIVIHVENVKTQLYAEKPHRLTVGFPLEPVPA